MEPLKLSRSLISFRATEGGTSVFIDLEIAADGTLAMEGQDLGRAPQEVYGDSDYEYWARISPEHKDLLLITLLAEKYTGDFSAMSKFRDWLTTNEIPYEGGSF